MMPTIQVFDPALCCSELPLLERVRGELALRVAVVPLLAEAPVGAGPLREMVRGAAESFV